MFRRFKVGASQSASSISESDHPIGHVFQHDILTRFRALQGSSGSGPSGSVKAKFATSLDIPELQNEDNEKTVEDLLAELGPEEEWAVGQEEEDQVRELLSQAQEALRDTSGAGKNDQVSGTEPGAVQDIHHELNQETARISVFDVSAFQPEPESDPDDATEKRPQNRTELNQSLDKEADDYL